MSFRDIWTVAKKELKAGFTDKIVLLQIIPKRNFFNYENP